MYIIMGASGHVGAAVAEALLGAGQPVTVVVRSEDKGAAWRHKGCQIAVADLDDPQQLRQAFRAGQRAFLLNPPAPPGTDSDVVERASAAHIVEALRDSGLEQLVAESTYGAQPGEHLGDLGVLYEFEQALLAQPVPTRVLRAAYYMSNWDAALQPARHGELPSLLPADLRIPMVAPADIGRAAARLLQQPAGQGISHVEGPEEYAPTDVADALSRALQRPVRVVMTPPDQWVAAYRRNGLSLAAAESYARMTGLVVDQQLARPRDAERGLTPLAEYLSQLVMRS